MSTSDALQSAAPGTSAISRPEFLNTWDNNAGVTTVAGIDDQVVTFDEIKQAGGVVAFAKAFESLAPADRQDIYLQVSDSERALIAQAVHNVRLRYFDPNESQPTPPPAQRFDLASWDARQQIQVATEHLMGLGFESKDVKATQIVKDPLGMTHVRLDRLVEELPVYGEQIVVHFKNGVTSIGGSTQPTPVLEGAADADTLDAVIAETVRRFGIQPAEMTVKKAAIRQGDTAIRGWVIDLSNFARPDDGPRAMTFVVDGQSSSLIAVSDRGVDGKDGGAQTTDSAFIAAFRSSDGIVHPKHVKTSAQTSTQGPAKITKEVRALVKLLVAEEGRASGGVLAATVQHDAKGVWSLKAAEVKEEVQRPEGPLRPWQMIGLKESTPKKSMIADGEVAEPTAPVILALDQLLYPKFDDYVPYSSYVRLSTSMQGAENVLYAKSWEHDGIETRDAAQEWDAENANVVTYGEHARGPDATRGEKSGAAAHYAAMMTYQFLREMGFNSIDLRGEKLISNVNIGKGFVNAYWNGTAMHYGEGDGKAAGPLTTLDIGGHEIAHGLTERTANLIYADESGGLNESFSDIAGFMVEYLASKTNPAVTPDWIVGEDTWTPNNGNHHDGLRYMDDPAADKYSIEHYSKYPQQTEVHGSSGIQNNAFYQLAYPDNRTKKANRVSEVAVQDGLGVEKASRIFFRALAYYLTPNSTFADARDACITAAKDLHGADSVEAKKTAEAWSAVGVETAA